MSILIGLAHEPVFNAAVATQIVFQQPARSTGSVVSSAKAAGRPEGDRSYGSRVTPCMHAQGRVSQGGFAGVDTGRETPALHWTTAQVCCTERAGGSHA
ncbi:MAG: hypothetical protein B7X51_13230 [Pseudomonas sp. 34-62-33]|nr:MAG: hypothetical protein B7X51_13230 [Pseudomonas sp. 34-62-33]